MGVFIGLIVLSIGAALALIGFIVTREVPRRHVVILVLVTLIIVSSICLAVGYFGLRVHISDHYEINLVLLSFFVLPPIAAGVIAGLSSAAMFRAVQSRERGTPNV